MSDRLKDLQRQRALAQEQLTWLDQEIARESSATNPVPVSRPVPPAAVPSPDEIIAQYHSQARPVHSEVKRGCFIYFFAAFGLVGLGILALYFLRRH